MRKTPLIANAAGILLAASLPSLVSAAEAGLCNATETPVFTCHSADKIASLCAAGVKDFSHLRYAYGTLAKTELSYPAAGIAARDAFRHGIISYSGSGGDYVRFDNGGFGFSLFYLLGRNGQFDGVIVSKGDKIVKNIVCSKNSTDELTTEFFQQAALPEVPDNTPPFEVPEVFFNAKR